MTPSIVQLGDEVLGDDALALHADGGGDVAGFGLADERVDEQPVADLLRDLAEILVRAVDGVAGLERGDGLPAAMLGRPRASWLGQAVVQERLWARWGRRR